MGGGGNRRVSLFSPPISLRKHSIKQEKQCDFLKDLVAKGSAVAGQQTEREEAGTTNRKVGRTVDSV